MKRTLLASAAAMSLFAATNLVAAQGTSQGGTKEAPAPKADTAPPPKASGSSAPGVGTPKGDSTAQEKVDPKGAQQRTQDKGDTKASDKTDPAPKAGDTKPAAADTKPAGQAKPTSSDNKPAAGETKPTATDTKSDAAKSSSAPAAAPPPEKRTQITTSIKQQKVQEVTNVNFNVSIGSRVPSSVNYHPLPSTIVEIYPEWRGYYFILVKGRYLVLRPQTYEIVYIIED